MGRAGDREREAKFPNTSPLRPLFLACSGKRMENKNVNRGNATLTPFRILRNLIFRWPLDVSRPSLGCDSTLKLPIEAFRVIKEFYFTFLINDE